MMKTNLKQAIHHDTGIEVLERKNAPGVWTVEILDYNDEGACYVTAFHGPNSEKRARAYADWQRRQ